MLGKSKSGFAIQPFHDNLSIVEPLSLSIMVLLVGVSVVVTIISDQIQISDGLSSPKTNLPVSHQRTIRVWDRVVSPLIVYISFPLLRTFYPSFSASGSQMVMLSMVSTTSG